jgi:tetrahydromethanopterin S-methyltransferase subunit G
MPCVIVGFSLAVCSANCTHLPQTANHQGEHVPPEFQPEMPMFGANVNTHASDRGNEPVTWNQFHTFANQMDSRFVALEAQFIAIEGRFIAIEGRFIAIEARFNEMDARFIAIETRFNEIDKRFNELDAKINQLRGEFLEFKEEMRLVPVKIAGWVAGAMIGSSGVIFGGFQLLRGLL